MTFSDAQVRKLSAPVRPNKVKERQVEGKTLHYLEGWHIVAEANRIFGFDGWDRETISSQCVWQKQIDYRFGAAYLTRVRITVRAGDSRIVREGLGSGEATAPTSGQAHERASKAAETDATKRALSTFGNPFGLSLYRDKGEQSKNKAASHAATAPSDRSPAGFQRETSNDLARANPRSTPSRIEKSELTLSEPKRLRNNEHLRRVAAQPCLVCGRAPSQAHHLRFAQPRALARKVSDEFTVPLCALHHQELHLRGNEVMWWADKNVDPLPIAEELWNASRAGKTEAAE